VASGTASIKYFESSKPIQVSACSSWLDRRPERGLRQSQESDRLAQYSSGAAGSGQGYDGYVIVRSRPLAGRRKAFVRSLKRSLVNESMLGVGAGEWGTRFSSRSELIKQ